ncbi:MAG: prephenate dehydratase [Lysobacterales bacterium CG02_land_8_20_14_3_00_62_12]|nr:MAG: prephenate dehydratase [Xanthomonadales bacterium CG02_land_8_20_14_3_00_62_12]
MKSPVAKSPPGLLAVRNRIDAIDGELQRLIAERATVARQVGEAKGKGLSAVDFYRPEREAQVLRKVLERNQGPLSNDEMLRLFREIMSACLAQQEPLKIAFLGPEGTFSEIAVHKHFGHSIHGLPLGSIDEVFQEVEAGNADFGVVPVENSTEGSVQTTMDMFLTSPLKVCGEVELPIHHFLLAHHDQLAQVQRVFSHPQSLGQCRLWLRTHLPHAERIAVASNAEAARRARSGEDVAAIAGESAGRIYGLNTLAGPIEDRPDNTSRFVVLGREMFSPSGNDKTSLLLSGKDQPGLLFHLLEPLARNGVSLTRIESRPTRQGKWQYAFFIDIAGHIDDPKVQKALSELGPVSDLIKVLGSYPEAVTSA